MTGKTFVIDPRIRGDVTVISDTELDADGVYQLLLSVLKTQEYSLIENGDIVEVIQSTRARMQGGSRQDVLGDQPGDAWVTKVIDAGDLDPNEIIKSMRQLAPQHAQFSAIAESNAVLITDRKQNVEGMVRIVEHLKSSASVKSIVVNLEHTFASETLTLLEDLLGDTNQELKIIANLRNNSLLLRGTQQSVMDALDSIEILDQPSTALASTRVFRLRQAIASEIASIVTGMLGPPSSGTTSTTTTNSGTSTSDLRVLADESLNAIVVKANPSDMREIEALIEQLDQRRAQVLIEAAIIEVTLTEGLNAGVELGIADNSSDSLPAASSSLNGILGALLTNLNAVTEDGEGTEAQDILANMTSPSLAIAKLDPDGLSFGAIVNALASVTYTKLLSTPSVMALNNEASSFLSGQSVPLRSGNLVFPNQDSIAGIRPTSRRDIGVTLNVTPSIHEDLTVRLTIEQTVESLAAPALGIGDAGFADIVTNKRSITTVVVAEDQQTIVLGGLIRDEVVEKTRKVPGLGNIPVVGRLFRTSDDSNSRSLLIVFIRPTVVSTPTEADQVTTRKHQDFWEVDFSDEEVGQRPLNELIEGKF